VLALNKAPLMADLLRGIRVIDLTNNVAGPMATYQLSQLGAEVIKVEAPGTGDPARRNGGDPKLNAIGMGIAFLAHGAGKKSLTLNLKSPAGLEVLFRLLMRADVLVASFRPGVMERLGLGYSEVKAKKADIVYCSLSGFGVDGPLASTPAYDQIIQGLSGLMSITGDPASGPLRVGFPVSDAIAGITTAFAVCAALVRRERTGEGECIDVSMLESTLVAMGWVVLNALVAGIEPAAMGNQNVFASPSGAFATADGLVNIAAHTQKQFATLCTLIGRPDLVADERFAGNEDRKHNRSALSGEIERALAHRSSREWAALLNDHGVPAGEVLSVSQALAQPQIAERDFVKCLADVAGASGPIRVLRSGFRLGGGDPGPKGTPPALGGDTDDLLREIGYAPDDIERLRSQNAV
jgi:crotonobetainyl-CoA:carnitine CoA-transferase CaiB-like acyl-CoA transferase